VLAAFLHRACNGGASSAIVPQARALDLLVTYGDMRLPIELKVWRPGDRDPREEGIAQLERSMSDLGVSTGWLVVFDRRPDLPRLSDRVSHEVVRTVRGNMITVVRA
jgi:hypothetical protein